MTGRRAVYIILAVGLAGIVRHFMNGGFRWLGI